MIPALHAAEMHPLRVACMLDQTGSSATNRISQLHVANFDELIALIGETGGEIAVGAIRDRSNLPLLRCRLEEKPVRHAQEPGRNVNVFIRQRLMRMYLSDKAAEDRDELSWSQESERRISEFRNQLKGLLEHPLAGRTDIFGAVTRADLFLSEPDDGWKQPARRIAVFYTDGIDNVRAPVTTMTSGAAVLMVNGAALLGSLAPLKPVRLESFPAAVRYIRSEAQKE
jgi:hypothetical protein